MQKNRTISQCKYTGKGCYVNTERELVLVLYNIFHQKRVVAVAQWILLLIMYNKLGAGICKRMPSSAYLTEHTTRGSKYHDQRTPNYNRRPRRAHLHALRSSGIGAYDHVRISVRGFQSEARRERGRDGGSARSDQTVGGCGVSGCYPGDAASGPGEQLADRHRVQSIF